jgi:type IV secretion system protein VirB9
MNIIPRFRFFTFFAVPALFLSVFLSASCRTTHFDRAADAGPEGTGEAETYREELAANAAEERRIAIEEELKEVDVERTVIYVDRPVYSPVEIGPEEEAPAGEEAVKRSNGLSVQVPQDFTNGIMYYAYDESFEYEIHTQPYRTTDISLEPGEQVLEMPFLSEEKVWEIGAGVSREGGRDVQHFFVKPSVGRLTTSMIIITDRRVYHLLLKSFSDRYMVMVKWRYPGRMPFTLKTDAMREAQDRVNGVQTDLITVDPAMLSFDYRMTYSLFRKPLWLPQRVYDDGARTYIQLDERMLHAESPVMFNHRNERINYRVNKNLIVIDELIEKVTLRRGREKVAITKKNYRPAAGTGGSGNKESE